MNAFKHILVATDFGEASDRALDVAVAMAEKFGAQLTLLHASWIPPVYDAYGQGFDWHTDEMTSAAKKELSATLVKAKERYPTADGLVVTAEPWDAILRIAKARGADLIVMGTHGRRGLSRVFLGSVAEKVVRLSPIPVLTVSGKADQESKETSLAAASTGTA